MKLRGCLAFIFGLWTTSIASYATPLSSCVFYQSPLIATTFVNGASHFGCAEFSAVLGRRGCKKIKGTCPLCVRYPGDHLQMWLPDYFIEVTKHVGKSVFTDLPTGLLLSKQLSLAKVWTDQALLVPSNSLMSNGTHSTSGSSSFWHARILTTPYGFEVNQYPPLKAPTGSGFPHCFSAISEFYPSQWQLNLVDGPYALAWMPLGISLCNNPAAEISAELVALAHKNIASASGTSAGGADLSSLACAMPVGAKEGALKNALPSSDCREQRNSADNLKKTCSS